MVADFAGPNSIHEGNNPYACKQDNDNNRKLRFPVLPLQPSVKAIGVVFVHAEEATTAGPDAHPAPPGRILRTVRNVGRGHTLEDPFYSPKAKLRRANQHIASLHRRIEAFFKEAPYHRAVELDADGTTELHKLKFTKRLPEICIHNVDEALVALRSALDQCGYASAVASGKIKPKRTQFPMADEPKGFDFVIRRQLCDDLPNKILSLFVSFQPYQGGNNALWALNKLRNATHTVLVPVAVANEGALIRRATGRGPFALPAPIYDSCKNEIVFARVGVGGEFNYEVEFSFLVTIGEIDIVARHQAVAVLRTMSAEVKRVLVATEAECRRLGFI